MIKRFLIAALGWLLAAGVAGAAGIPANVFQYAPANPATTTSTTAVMAGVGLSSSFTPHYDGVALIVISGAANDSAISAGGKFSVQYGTGAAPANAATITGSTCGAPIITGNGSLTGNVANVIPFSITCVATGLALNTGYWIDVAYSVTAASTLTLTNVSVSAVEQ